MLGRGTAWWCGEGEAVKAKLNQFRNFQKEVKCGGSKKDYWSLNLFLFFFLMNWNSEGWRSVKPAGRWAERDINWYHKQKATFKHMKVPLECDSLK